MFLWYSFQEQDLTRPYNKYLINYVICLVIITGKSQTSALMFDRAQGFGLRFPRNELTLGYDDDSIPLIIIRGYNKRYTSDGLIVWGKY